MTTSPLTFDDVSAVSRARAARWHPGFPDDTAWSGADWSNAMCGEAGEAANVVKKLRRYETGAAPGPLDPPPEQLRSMLADAIADVFLYLDLLAAKYDIDLPAAIVSKFNRVSERQGFPERLHLDGLDVVGDHGAELDDLEPDVQVHASLVRLAAMNDAAAKLKARVRQVEGKPVLVVSCAELMQTEHDVPEWHLRGIAFSYTIEPGSARAEAVARG